MTKREAVALLTGAVLAAGVWTQTSCSPSGSAAQVGSEKPGLTRAYSTQSILPGTQIGVALGSEISSETAHVGDSWHGTVTENVPIQNGGMLPAGSAVSGAVVGVTPAKRGSRAMLALGVLSIHVNGRSQPVAASSEAVIAGSTRARNLGAIAGSAAAGALIGNSVGDGRNATVGGVIGGVAAAGVVAASKGYQVVLHDGTRMSFTVNQTASIR